MLRYGEPERRCIVRHGVGHRFEYFEANIFCYEYVYNQTKGTQYYLKVGVFESEWFARDVGKSFSFSKIGGIVCEKLFSHCLCWERKYGVVPELRYREASRSRFYSSKGAEGNYK